MADVDREDMTCMYDTCEKKSTNTKKILSIHMECVNRKIVYIMTHIVREDMTHVDREDRST